MRRTALLLLAVGCVACVGPSLAPCAVLCGEGAHCPAGTSCRADGYCHAPDQPQACGSVDAPGVADAPGPADAATAMDADAPGCPSPQAPIRADDFADGVTDPMWEPFAAAGASVAEAAGALRITPPSSATGAYAGYRTRCGLDLTVQGAQVTVDTAMFASTVGATVSFSVAVTPQYALQLGAEAGKLYFGRVVDGAWAEITRTDLLARRIWRLRGEPSGLVYAEYSVDGVAWQGWSAAPPAGLGAPVTFTLQAGTYNPVASPGTAGFDDFRPLAP